MRYLGHDLKRFLVDVTKAEKKIRKKNISVQPLSAKASGSDPPHVNFPFKAAQRWAHEGSKTVKLQ